MNTDKVIACLKAIGFAPDACDFQDRIRVQKMVYLLQLKGLETGFDYNLYVRGPYSPALTKELFERKDAFKRLNTGASLSVEEEEAVRELNALFELKPSLLEVAATYAFFAREKRLDPIAALTQVKKLKPFFSEAQTAVGISKAKEFLFKPTAAEREKIKRDFSGWESTPLETGSEKHEERRNMAG